MPASSFEGFRLIRVPKGREQHRLIGKMTDGIQLEIVLILDFSDNLF